MIKKVYHKIVIDRDEYSIRKFDMSQIKDDKVVVLVGKRETVKVLCKDLLLSSTNSSWNSNLALLKVLINFIVI